MATHSCIPIRHFNKFFVGLILVAEPYYNEAGYEKQKGTEQGRENSRMYNEMVLIKLVQSMSRQIVNPPAPWIKEIKQHIYEHGPRLVLLYLFDVFGLILSTFF